MQSQQSDAWMTIAQAIKQGPSLPNVELMKFSGDLSKYAEFLTNLRDKYRMNPRDSRACLRSAPEKLKRQLEAV